MNPIAELGSALRTAESFEGAAKAVLRAGRRLLGGMLSDWGAAAIIRSGTVHLYPDSPRQIVFGTQTDLPPSRSAWRFIQRHLRPVILDARTGEIVVLLEDEAYVEQVPPGATQTQVRASGATHLHVSPLFGPGGVIGQLSYAVEYRTDLDFESLVDDEFVDCLMTMAELTANRVAILPRAEMRNSLCNAWVPVVGRRTQSTLRLLDRYAQHSVPIVLRGPFGCGRTHLARWVHARSARLGVFEIFDASAQRDMPCALADTLGRGVDGTVLIRRPDLLDAGSQALLSAHLVARAAGARVILHADERWTEAVQSGAFERELAALVQDLTVLVSPLREREDEIDGWARFFVGVEGGQATWSDDALMVLRARIWSDNLHGLRTVVRQARMCAVQAAQGPAVIEPQHLARVPYVSRGRPDMARQEATLRAGLEAFAEVLLRAEQTNGVRLEGAAGLVLWRLAQLAGGRDAALTIMRGRSPSRGNAARAWARKIEPAIELARQLGLHTLVAELEVVPE